MIPEDCGMLEGATLAGPANEVAALTFLSIALYNVTELIFIIFATFKRRNGLYFWSFLVATVAIIPYCVGFLIKDLSICDIPGIYVTLICAGWSTMVTGQSLVLYSRLHLVLREGSRLRLVLRMIIFNAAICTPTVIVLASAIHSSHPERFLEAYTITERVQVTIFFVQEFIISGLYVWETAKLRRLEASIHANGTARHIMLISSSST